LLSAGDPRLKADGRVRKGGGNQMVGENDRLASGAVESRGPVSAVPESDIKETVTADVVIVGAGLAGACAAVSAAEAGADTVVLEKGLTTMAHGTDNGVIGSSLQRELGIEVDKAQLVTELMRWASFRIDQRLVTLWADRGGQVMDWLLDLAAAAGLSVEVESNPWTGEWTALYSSVHRFEGGNRALLSMLEGKALELGAQINYNTPAVQLLSKQDGRVSGVIAATPEGDYRQFNSKAVVLCTGDYGGDREMLERYCPWAADSVYSHYYPPLNTGDGHKMGLRIGAAMDEVPHCSTVLDGRFTDPSVHEITGQAWLTITRQAWLNVNIRGERYVNEMTPASVVARADMLQPGHMKWSVWDGNWEADVAAFGDTMGRLMPPAPGYRATLQKAVDRGNIKKARTIEELAQMMQVPQETFLATVARYNELARTGQDLDFYKPASRLTTIDKPPFYAAKTGGGFYVTLGGLKVNSRLQVLDTDANVIPGLHAAGNVSGGFFANLYPIIVPGISHGRALTFGRLAGLNAATDTI
jgi:fumarate reductase flavoprotein subunit